MCQGGYVRGFCIESKDKDQIVSVNDKKVSFSEVKCWYVDE